MAAANAAKEEMELSKMSTMSSMPMLETAERKSFATSTFDGSPAVAPITPGTSEAKGMLMRTAPSSTMQPSSTLPNSRAVMQPTGTPGVTTAPEIPAVKQLHAASPLASSSTVPEMTEAQVRLNAGATANPTENAAAAIPRLSNPLTNPPEITPTTGPSGIPSTPPTQNPQIPPRIPNPPPTLEEIVNNPKISPQDKANFLQAHESTTQAPIERVYDKFVNQGVPQLTNGITGLFLMNQYFSQAQKGMDDFTRMSMAQTSAVEKSTADITNSLGGIRSDLEGMHTINPFANNR